jgi:nitrogen fixation protein FixH
VPHEPRPAKTPDRRHGAVHDDRVLCRRDRGQSAHDAACDPDPAGQITKAHEQSARNWKVDAHVERSGQGGATLQVEARDSNGRPMSGLKFQGRFERPTDRRGDLPVELAEVGIGIYRGSAPAVAPGQWDLVIEGASAGQRLFLSRNRVLLN